MSDVFNSAWLCWTQGKDHIVDLHKRAQTFFKTKPYTFVAEPSPDGSHQHLKIKFLQPLPDKLTAVISDAVTNLRSALDHACYAIAVASGITDPKAAYFPFGSDISDFEGKFKAKSKDIPEQIRPLFCSFQPYKGGNSLLWALNRIRNANVHTMLKPAIIVIGGYHVQMTPSKTGVWKLHAPWWDRTNQEIILSTGPLDIEIRGDVDLSLDVAFDQVEVVQSQPAVPVLYNLANVVSQILFAIELESARLDLIS